ncbi:MAG: hypothetical protein GXY10_03115 [Clostridiales bacterium]|nr:hypothetical protein [Clostridiales bacterium]
MSFKAHNRFSINFLAFAFLLIFCVAFFSLSSISVNDPKIAFAAGNKASSNASLDNGYLKPGTNLLSTAAAQEDSSGGYWPAMGYETTGYNGVDFYSPSGTSATFTPDNVSFFGGNIGVKSMLDADTLSPYSALSKAMQDQNFIISFVFESQIQIGGNSGDDPVTLQTSIKWYPAGTGGAVYSQFTGPEIIQPVGASFSQKIYLGGDNADVGSMPDPLNVLYTTAPITHNSACFVVEIFDITNSDSVPVYVSSPRIHMDVEISTLSINLDAYGVAVQGVNRETTNIPGVKNYETEGPTTLENTFVKTGDTITVSAQVMNSGLPYEFPNYYTALFFPIDENFNDRTCLDWHTYSFTYDESISSYLSRVPLPPGASEQEIENRYSGYSVQYSVKSGVGNTPQVKLLPRLPVTIVSGTVNYFEFDIASIPEKEIVVKVDDSAPSSPIIDSTKGLGVTIESREWYTASRTILLDYSSTLTTDLLSNAQEKVFAYVLDPSVSSFDPAECDFSKPAADASNNYPFGDGVSIANMQDLGLYSNITLGGGKLPLVVPVPGEYTLVLIAADEAGNISSPYIYHSGNRQSIKVDDTSKEVGFILKYGNTEFTSGYASTVGDIYIYIGSNWHTKNVDGSYTFTAGDNQLSGDNIYQKRVTPAKRNQPVTLRFLMRPTNYETYKVVRYSSQPAMDGMWSDNPVYRVGRDGRYYEITFSMNDEIWSSSQNSGLISMFFNKKVDLGLKSSDFSFTKNNNTGLGEIIGIEGYIEAFFPYNPLTQPKVYPPVQPDINVVYYRLEEYQVFVKTKIENNQTVTTTGGYIIYNGTQYDLPDEYDLLAATRVGNTVQISEGIDNINLTTITRNDGPLITGYKSYYNNGYIAEDYYDNGFVDAGRYVYKASVDLSGDTNLFGEKVDIYEVKKANPRVYGLHGENTLYYGDSMAEIIFASTYENGTPVFQPSFTYADRIYYMSSAGVYGYYEITSPSAGTPQYTLPGVTSSLNITVNFYPIDVIAGVDNSVIAANWGNVFYNYYERTMTESGYVYSLIPGKSHSLNYNIQTIQIAIEIRPSLAYLGVNAATTRTTFNQEPQGLEVQVFSDADKTQIIENVYTNVLYRDKSDPNSVFTVTKPTNAGLYQAKIDIDTTRSNYYNEASLYQDFTIDKMVLEIVPVVPEGDEDTTGYIYEKFAIPEIYGEGSQYQSTCRFTFKYGYLDVPDYQFGVFVGENFIETTGLLVEHTFFQVKGPNGNGLDPYGDRIVQTTPGILISDLLSAGTHLAEISIENQNYEGELTATFAIEQGTAEGNLLTVNMPLLNRNYDAVGLDGTLQGKLGQIEFGQTLEGMSGQMLLNADTRGSYTFRNKTAYISGRFYFEDEDTYYLRIGGAQTPRYNSSGERILDVKYGTGSSANRIVPHTVTLYWQAGQFEGETFVPNLNFSLLSFPADIYVVRAVPNMSGLRLSDIVYKDKLSSSVIEGNVVSNGITLTPVVDYNIRIAVNPETVYPGGTHNVLCVFEPSPSALYSYRRIENIPIPLTVEKREVEFSFPSSVERQIEPDELNEIVENPFGIAYIFGSMYQNPATIIKNADDDSAVLDAQLEYIYFKDFIPGYVLSAGESIMPGYENYVRMAGTGINNSTPVGKYYMLLRTVGSNYSGTSWKDFYVVKADLYVETPNKPVIEYGTSLALVEFPLINAQNADSTKIISGRFSYEIDIIPEVGDTTLYVIEFTPASAFAMYQNFKPLTIELGIVVQKKTLTISVSNLTHTYTGAQKQVSGVVANPDNSSENLPLIYTYSTFDNSIPRDSGVYDVTVSIAPQVQKYRGSRTVTMTINKSPVSIVSSDIEKIYTGMPQPFVPVYSIVPGTLPQEFQISNENGFKITYYNRQRAVMASAPVNVGLYYVSVELITQNYTGQSEISYWIAPNLKSVNDLEQTYCPPSTDPNAPKVKQVSLSFNDVTVTRKDDYGIDQTFVESHQNVVYQILYRNNYGANQEFSSELDISNAGEYSVRIVYNENGYNKVLDGYVLIVNKAVLSLGTLDYYYSFYTGSPMILEGIILPGDVQLAEFSYRKYRPDEEEPEDFSPSYIPLDSDVYEVRIELIDDNFQGIAYTLFEIKKANLTIVETPNVFPIQFNSVADSILFVPGTGLVRFTTTGQTLTNFGTWTIESDTTMLIVGKGYPVVVRFTPNEDYSANFNFSEKEMSIDIIKKDIGSYIVFEEESLECSYSGSEQTALAFISPEANIVVGYGNIQLEYYYDGLVRNPKEVNTYQLIVRVNDKNYRGESSSRIFKIKKAEPVIVPPSLKAVGLNSTIDDSYIISGTGNGVNPNNDQIIVLGNFSFLETNMLMDKANYHPVWMSFQPNDSASYTNINFIYQVYVVGNAVNITSKTALPIPGNSIKYGTELSKFDLKLQIDGVDITSEDGQWRWKNPSQIVGVNGFAEFEFIPQNTDLYNIYTSTVQLTFIQSSDMDPLEDQCFAKIYVGDGIDINNPLSTLILSTVVKNSYYPDITVNPNIEILQSDNQGIDFSTIMATAQQAGGYLSYNQNPLAITFRFKSANYNDTTLTIPVRVYNKLNDIDMVINSREKHYDGHISDISDFGIVISGTSRVIPSESILIKEIKLNGTDINEIRLPGDYQVTIEIDDTHYYGEKTFSYSVLKNDISSHLSILNNLRVFGDTTQVTTVSFGVYSQEVATTNSLILYNYIDRDGITSLGPLPPRDAGEYWLEISIDNRDQYFSAYKKFDYIIQKKEANIILNASYTYFYGENYSIIPQISNSLSGKDYSTQYYVSGQTAPLTSKPSNVGRYRVVFNINHRNYYGSSETLLVINRVRLQLNVPPTIDSLEYGVKLGTAGFLGGEVVTNDSAATRINGTFSFVDPNATPPRGTQAVQVRFIPSNDNFEPITFSIDIIISKRTANINFISSNCVYNGMPQLPTVRTDPALGINTRFTVYRDGLQVNSAIEVGNYRIIATIFDDNYEGFSILEVFQITKASAILSQSILPQASPIEFNQALNKSSLNGGSMVYVNNGLSVAGNFRYLNPDVMLGPVGTYNNISYLFVPIDTANYEIFESTLSIQVVKTNAVISANDTVFVYGSQLRRPTFVTNPANLNVTNDEFENEIDNLIEVGTYRFTASISDTNYKGSIVYNITIIKKPVEVQFYLGTVPVDSYRTTYGSIIYAKAKLKTTSLVPRDIQNVDEIEENLQYFYGSSISLNQTLSVSPPVSIGEYRAYVKMNHRNYEINETSSWISYQISRANVQRLEFDFTSLSTQVYGSVFIPNVLVTPSNVTVRVSFPGYPDMPTTAGTHSIRVEVIDPNYNPSFRNGTFIILPRQISIENIEAYDKAVDGLSDIRVTGTLGGVLQGDEVFLEMKARTEENLINVGTHAVIIDSWTLKGLHASNYSVRPPVYLLHVKITNKVVKDPITDSYITSTAGFNSNVTVSFKDVYDTINRTNFLTSLIGQKATVQTISIKENGLNTVLEEKVKFYVKIPEEYLNSENLEVKGLGNLSNQSITFTREGDYMTFYADTSGEIIFYNNDFPYWIIIVAASVILVVIGVILLFVLIPKKKRKVISSGARKAYEWTQEAKELDNKAEVLSRIREKEKRRRWRL